MKRCSGWRRLVLVVLVVGLHSLTTVQGLATGANSLIAIERAVSAVDSHWPHSTRVHQLDERDRESFALAKRLHQRLTAFRRNGDCGRCWLQQAHCICDQCPPLEDAENEPSPLAAASIGRVFVLTHHKEICLVVDTAKLIAASLPVSCRIVVGGIGPQFQESMREMLHCIQSEPLSCLVLFPSDEARTYNEILRDVASGDAVVPNGGWNVIVLDGTWEQARKLYHRYLLTTDGDTNQNKPPLQHVKLSDASLASILVPTSDNKNNNDLSHSMQLRRHPEEWRQISTLAATRLLFTEMAPEKADVWKRLSDYQMVADQAARKQLGPIRQREGKKK